MDFKLRNCRITDTDISSKIIDKLKMLEYSSDKVYDITFEFYNKDIIVDKLNTDIMFEIKPDHYRFIREIRKEFMKQSIEINDVYLLGTVSNLDKDEMLVTLNKAKKELKKENIIWPCKEFYLYDGSKKVLDNLLDNNQITLDEYNKNLELLQDEFGIYEIDEEYEYVN